MRTNTRLLAPLLVVVAMGAALPVQAQRWIFNPVIDLSANYDDNLTYAGTGDSSDTGSSIRVVLPVRRSWKTGSFSASYIPSYFQYQDFSALDRDEHRVRFNVNTRPSRTTSWGLGGFYTLTQDQGNPYDAGGSNDAVFLARRTELAVYGATIRLNRNEGANWGWNVGLGATVRDHSEIDPALSDPTNPNQVEDRTDYNAGFSMFRKLSETKNVGFRISQRRSELDISGDEDASSFSLTYNHEPGPRLKLGYQLGGFYADGTAAAGSADGSRTGVQMNFTLTREYRETQMDFRVAVSPSSGGDQRGTSTNSVASLAYSGDVREKWRWEIATYLAQRDPSDPMFPTLRSYSVRGDISRKLWRMVSLQFTTRVGVQTSSDPTYEDVTALGVRLGLIWHPLGRTPLGGGG